MNPLPAALAALAAATILTGCSTGRRLNITSEPPGALVWLNDVELGRTPLSAGFTYYGTYDVRVTLDGYEPLALGKKIPAPIREWPGPDLVGLALPGKSEHDWHFVLSPALERTQPRDEFEAGLRSRAQEFRTQLDAPPSK